MLNFLWEKFVAATIKYKFHFLDYNSFLQQWILLSRLEMQFSFMWRANRSCCSLNSWLLSTTTVWGLWRPSGFCCVCYLPWWENDAEYIWFNQMLTENELRGIKLRQQDDFNLVWKWILKKVSAEFLLNVTCIEKEVWSHFGHKAE